MMYKFLNIILVIVCLCIICLINKSYAIQRYNLCNISATPGTYEIMLKITQIKSTMVKSCEVENFAENEIPFCN